MNKLVKIDQPHGSGSIKFQWQSGCGIYLATTGGDYTVAIFNRSGKLVERIPMGTSGQCLDFGWDKDGDLLAVIGSTSSMIIIWDANSHRKLQLECGLKDTLSRLFWSKNGQILAVGTTKGNLCIYNHSTSRRVPILGKHAKSINCGSWNTENLLALGSEDHTISISDAEGDTLKVITLRAEPTFISFSRMKRDEEYLGQNTVSVVVGKKTIFLFNLHDPDKPIELAFQPKYGYIVSYHWYGDGYILIGFSEGYLISISTHVREIGQELFQVKNHRERLCEVAVSQSNWQVASCGDNSVKIHDIGSLPEISTVLTIDDDPGVESLSWSLEGQLLAVGTSYGSVHLYLCKLPTLVSCYSNVVCILSSLAEITLHTYTFDKNRSMESTSISFPVEIEPEFLQVGPNLVAVGMNNHAWFYKLGDDMRSRPKFAFDREFLGNVAGIAINEEYISALCEGKIYLTKIEEPDIITGKESKLFPESNENVSVTSQVLTSDFLIYSTDAGHVRYFCLEEWNSCANYKHASAIKKLWTNGDGVRCVICDLKCEGYLYDPAVEVALKIPQFPSPAVACLWETWHEERHCFVVFDGKCLFIYIYARDTIWGPLVTFVGEMKIANGHWPILLHRGELVCETTNGSVMHTLLSTHQTSMAMMKKDQKTGLKEILDRNLILLRYDECWNLCGVINERDCWLKLARVALSNLDIDRAIRIYNYLGDIGVVYALNAICNFEDKNFISARICSFFKDFDRAQDLYLQSSEPVEALRMRMHLLQWDIASELAKSLDPEQIPFISREYAKQLELMGKYTEALTLYKQALDLRVKDVSHVAQCEGGVARTSIKCGNLETAMKIIEKAESGDELRAECAGLLENLKRMKEAAVLYEMSGHFDEAASCYIRSKNWAKVGELLPNCRSLKIYGQYGKAMEAVGQYRKAFTAYEAGGDYDAAVRLALERLNDAEEAVRIATEGKSVKSAGIIAKYFQQKGDFSRAVTFLVASGCYDEALELAKRSGELPAFGEALILECGDEGTVPYFGALAAHFESVNDDFSAGKFYYHGKRYEKAADRLMEASKSGEVGDEAVALAIEVVAASNNDGICQRVVALLLGEVDGKARDPKLIFRLYMAKRQYREAAKVAIIIANEEQISGNYRNARDILFGMCCELRDNELKVSAEMVANLALLHSYMLAKLHAKRGDHGKAALLLAKVAGNISKFPSHAVQILTSAVIECHRAGMKKSAFDFATLLMNPEYRPKIDGKYRKKIEGVIRKSPREGLTDDFGPKLSPCPYCGVDSACDRLACSSCRNVAPFCIITGWRITRSNLTLCPGCRFPALHSEFIAILDTNDSCPICKHPIKPADLRLVTKADSILYPDGSE